MRMVGSLGSPGEQSGSAWKVQGTTLLHPLKSVSFLRQLHTNTMDLLFFPLLAASLRSVLLFAISQVHYRSVWATDWDRKGGQRKLALGASQRQLGRMPFPAAGSFSRYRGCWHSPGGLLPQAWAPCC